MNAEFLILTIIFICQIIDVPEISFQAVQKLEKYLIQTRGITPSLRYVNSNGSEWAYVVQKLGKCQIQTRGITQSLRYVNSNGSEFRSWENAKFKQGV